MPRAYIPRPCRRCGGEKGPKPYPSARPHHCAPCQQEVNREYWRKHFGWWCGSCDSPHYCETCRQNKRERQRMASAGRKVRSTNKYFRPFHAEHWWQQKAIRAVKTAIKRGLIPDLNGGEYACVDCGGVATEYEHRDYGRPYDVEPVCRGCNSRRGTAKWPTPADFQFVRLNAHQKAA